MNKGTGEAFGYLEKTKEHSDYFHGELSSLYQEETFRKEVKRKGLFGLRKEITSVPETRYFVVVFLTASDVKLRIPITEELSRKLIKENKVGQKVSVHLHFSYDFTCWFLSEKEKPVLDVI